MSEQVSELRNLYENCLRIRSNTVEQVRTLQGNVNEIVNSIEEYSKFWGSAVDVLDRLLPSPEAPQHAELLELKTQLHARDVTIRIQENQLQQQDVLLQSQVVLLEAQETVLAVSRDAGQRATAQAREAEMELALLRSCAGSTPDTDRRIRQLLCQTRALQRRNKELNARVQDITTELEKAQNVQVGHDVCPSCAEKQAAVEHSGDMKQEEADYTLDTKPALATM
ncbi:hypothetical protein G647_10297 [Cladophialophora carrionii CBS 160.54]|uniref:Uncharacterized protein n=1 Tax=Cladophialophora carrionii CBS 160.54 TaxID=1279043 RepID=V9DJG6_9EURO|nr:uncharacterized protein G647_10297 [Cladophialophora carrionii CBS 160.54]ETI26851.1 hypothetical protein G647_10297 [Cladophialophora carrionii CBS 160.54]